MIPVTYGCKQNCTFDGCDRARAYKFLCKQHYKQQWEGKQLTPIRNAEGVTDLDEFLRRTKPQGECWRWDTHTKTGYPGCWYRGTHWKAHRLSFHLTTGEDITGVPIHHKCATKWCVNPAHLQKATQAENTLEMMARKGYEAEISMLKQRVAELETQLEKKGVAILR